ncbi:hypothetical protein [Phocaeicola sartorii]|uniref:hypothetical protein n=1 Tax=Phocaeicola sartorii TaxID=671267 RepID=UPI003517627B
MIRISYNDFMPNSGNLSLDSIQDKLQELFLTDDEVVLEETDEQFNSSQKDRLAENIMKYLAEHTDNSASDSSQEISKTALILLGIASGIVTLITILFLNNVFDSKSDTPSTGIPYVYHDVIGTEYTLILFSDKTVSITERWAGDSELAKDLSGKKSKGSWRKVTYEGEPYITIDMTNGSSLYWQDDYIYTSYRAMKAKDYDYGFPISKRY